MNNLTGLDVLKGGYSLLQGGDYRWGQKSLFRAESGISLEYYEAGKAYCYCALGAMAKFLDMNHIIFAVNEDNDMHRAHHPLFKKAVEMLAFIVTGNKFSFIKAYEAIWDWNDKRTMTYHEVLLGFNEAIVYFEKENAQISTT